LPPEEAPVSQVKPILLAVVILGASWRFIGASGTNTILAPDPTADCSESPYSLFAITTTSMLAPNTKLKGSAVSALKGISHRC